MGLTLDPALAQAAAFCGVQWPAADETTLTSAGQSWSDFAPKAAEHADRCSQAIGHVTGQNAGPGVQALQDFVANKGHATATLADFASSIPQVADGYLRTARVVAAGKAAAMAELAVLAGFMAQAKTAGPEAVGPLLQLRDQVRTRVEAIWDRTATAIRSGA